MPAKDKTKEKFVITFWAVDQSADTALCNMDHGVVTWQTDGVNTDVQCLKNKKAIREGAELWVHEKSRQAVGAKGKFAQPAAASGDKKTAASINKAAKKKS